MQSQDYWMQRALQREDASFKDNQDTIRRLRQIYDDAAVQLVDMADRIFSGYARSNNLTSEIAKDNLNIAESVAIMEALRAEFEKSGSPEALAKLNAPVTSFSINRAQALRRAIEAEAAKVASAEEKVDGAQLAKTYDDAYYKTMHDTAQGLEEDINFSVLPAHAIAETIASPWQGKNYSERIWSNTNLLAQEAGKIIDAGITAGLSIRQMTDQLTDIFDAGAYAAERLIRTEVNRIHNAGTLRAFREMGAKEYTFLATLDARTCARCGALDGKHFKISDAQVGINLPPLHPNDRCVIMAYYSDVKAGAGTRIARDPTTGKNYKVNHTVTYPEWRKEINEKYGKGTLEKAQRLISTRSEDMTRYERYKARLGAAAPKDFQSFRDLKEGGGDELGVLEAQYRGMGYYDQAVQAEPKITEAVKARAGETGVKVHGLQNRIKSSGEYLRKIRKNYSPKGNTYEVKDILRYTYVADPEDLADRTLSSIDLYTEKGYNTVEMKNTWLKPNMPYRGINTTIKAPNGQKFELQYHTAESAELRDGRLHEIYEKARLLDRRNDEYIHLNDEMIELSSHLTVPAGIERVK
jgi:SPP1 gp7 family putative phage head morphogenesis protein